MDFVKNLTGGGNNNANNENQPQATGSEQKSEGGFLGGIGDKLNSAAGGGAEGEKKEGEVREPASPHDFDGNERSRRESAAKRRKLGTESVSARPVSATHEQQLTNNSQMDVDKEPEAPKMRKVKKQQRKGDLPLSAGTASLDDETKSLQAERENAMIMEDKLVQDTENEKNNLESMIYELKDKIIDQYKDFASDDEKSRLNAKLEQIEVC